MSHVPACCRSTSELEIKLLLFIHYAYEILLTTMNPESPPSYYPYLCQRFQALVWSCLDSDLTKTAVFHAERYFALDRTNHESRHLYATALLREGQTYSALALVNGPRDEQCTGCLEIKAKCCTTLGRHRQARDALEATLQDNSYVSSGSSMSWS